MLKVLQQNCSDNTAVIGPYESYLQGTNVQCASIS